MERKNALRKTLERCYAPLLTGSKICIISYATIVLLPIVLRVLPLLQPCLGGKLESSYPTVVVPSCESRDPVTMRKRDSQHTIRIKNQAESRRAVKDCDIQVGDAVLVRQPKREKLSTPYHLTPLTVTKRDQSMLTAEGADRKVTCNSFHFKKLLVDDSSRSRRPAEGQHFHNLSYDPHDPARHFLGKP